MDSPEHFFFATKSTKLKYALPFLSILCFFVATLRLNDNTDCHRSDLTDPRPRSI